MTWLWCSNLSSIAVAITVSPSSSPQSAKPLFNVSMMLSFSHLADTRLKNAVADSLSYGQMPNSSTISTLGNRYTRIRRSSLCSALAFIRS